MAFELIKKGLHGLQDKLAGRKGPQGHEPMEKGGAKKGLGAMGFEDGERSLMPEENKKEPQKKGPKDNRTLLEKADDALGLGQRFRTDAWTKRQWKTAKEKLAKLSPDEWIDQHYNAFLAFAQKEYSSENVHAYVAVRQALSGQMSRKDFFEAWMAPGSENEINTPFNTKYKALADEGRYAEMDLEAVQREIANTLSDTASRAQFDNGIIRHMFTFLTGMTPPEEIDQGYTS